MSKIIKVKCPNCSDQFSYYSSEFRPFCSERCKMVDMGKWFDESYSIKGRDNSVYIEDSDKLQQLIDDENENY